MLHPRVLVSAIDFDLTIQIFVSLDKILRQGLLLAPFAHGVHTQLQIALLLARLVLETSRQSLRVRRALLNAFLLVLPDSSRRQGLFLVALVRSGLGKMRALKPAATAVPSTF